MFCASAAAHTGAEAQAAILGANLMFAFRFIRPPTPDPETVSAVMRGIHWCWAVQMAGEDLLSAAVCRREEGAGCGMDRSSNAQRSRDRPWLVRAHLHVLDDGCVVID